MPLRQDGGEDAAPVRVLMKADPSSRESLQAEADIDPMDGEQTWPTESELLEAEGAEKEQFSTSHVAGRKSSAVFATWPDVKFKHIR